jgi:DNA-binding NtrC family response regulator
MAQILLVDDDELIISAFRRTLRKFNWTIDAFSNPLDALAATETNHYNLLISDYMMPQMNGIDFLEQAHRNVPDALLIIMSANIDLQGLTDALNRANVHRFIPKPWDDLLLGRMITEAITHQNLVSENARLANEVRRQKAIIDKQQQELARLEQESPGITQVEFDEDGAIVLDENDY